MNSNLEYLVAAYSVVWLILAFFIWVLINRNRKLLKQLDELESRLEQLERDRETASGN